MADALTTVVIQSRRRELRNLVFENLTVGAAAALSAAIALLLLGSAILEWYWVLVLFLGGVAVSAWRTWRSLPSHYETAQAVDRRLGLNDAISTAYHFAQKPPADPLADRVIAVQRAEAERIASTVDLGMAVPARVPRQIYAAIAIAAVGVSLFALRYGILGTLDLKAPIVEAVADFFRPGPDVVARNKQSQAPRQPGEEPMSIAVDTPNAQQVPLDQAPDAALDTVDVPDTNQGETKDDARQKQQQVKAAADQQGDDMSEGSENADRSADNGKEGRSESGKEGGSDKASKQGEPQKPNQQGSGKENSSMMDKMRDAMANLMAKLKVPQQTGQQQRQMAANQKGEKQGGQQDQGGGQKGEKGQGQSQGKGTPSDDPDADQAEGEQQAQAGQGKSNDKGSEQGSPNESKSGMGKQDGSKDIKNAEQMAAMGKITEIFGKRAQNVTGEVMVEVSSTKSQQLRTAYTQRGASHKEAGGEVHRDEIPLVFQHYVQQYFEQVRKGESTAQPKPATPAPAAPSPEPQQAPRPGASGR